LAQVLAQVCRGEAGPLGQSRVFYEHQGRGCSGLQEELSAGVLQGGSDGRRVRQSVVSVTSVAGAPPGYRRDASEDYDEHHARQDGSTAR
jgi:hypothetical protein